jgi:hypothetical protein
LRHWRRFSPFGAAPAQTRGLIALPGLDHRPLAAPQPKPFAGREHVVEAAAVAGEPDHAGLDLDPPRMAQVQAARRVDVQIADLPIKDGEGAGLMRMDHDGSWLAVERIID